MPEVEIVILPLPICSMSIMNWTALLTFLCKLHSVADVPEVVEWLSLPHKNHVADRLFSDVKKL